MHACERACTRRTGRNALAGNTQSCSTEHTGNLASKVSQHHAETRHPGTADAAHGHARAGLRERNGAKSTREAKTHTQPQAAVHIPSAHAPRPANHPGIMQKPGIPAQQMQRTGTRERACGSGTGQNALAEHAQHARQPHSIAWAGGGEAAMKGGAPYKFAQ
jgi:hypothetical protein